MTDKKPFEGSDLSGDKAEKLTVTGQRIVENPRQLWERVEVLEALVFELCALKRRRSERMRNYMARKRAK